MNALRIIFFIVWFAVLVPLLNSASGEVAPIKIAANARSERAFLKAQRVWSERVLEIPFRERSKGMPWEKTAVSFVSRALDNWPGDRLSPHTPQLSKDGQTLLADGCTDPKSSQNQLHLRHSSK